jgi:hypothetical protein
MAKTKTVTISRARWLDATRAAAEHKKHPDGHDDRIEPSLYNPETKAMCCLGFVARQVCKLPVRDIKRKGFIRNVLDQIPFERDAEFSESQIAMINDAENLTRKQRESRLKAYFKTHTNLRLEFVP